MRQEICSLGGAMYLAVDYLPLYWLPSIMKDGQAHLPAQLVLMDETLKEPIYVDPENPNLVWEDEIEAIASWMLAAIEAYENVWEKQLTQLQIRKEGYE